jgi:tRNA-dihydrouridine synthase B
VTMKFPKLSGKALLSPMSGVTDVAFRALCKKYGAALTYTEFVSSTAIVRGNNKSLELLKTDKIEKPVAVQLFGNDIKEVVAAARMLEDKFDIIDINCGCPAWKVIKTGAGSELLKSPGKISKFVSKLASSVRVPVTVKIRSGINKNNINAIDVAKMVQDAGAAALAIHGRTQKQGYTGLADWEIIKKVKQTIDIPVIGNGDIFTPKDFWSKQEFSDVDYVMVARGAIGNPYLFRQIDDFNKKKTYSTINKLECFFEYLKLARKHILPFPTIKNQALAFTKGTVGGAKIRLELSKASRIEEIVHLMNFTNS